MIASVVAVTLTILLVIGLHALAPKTQRLQDDRSYQYGYNSWGSAATKFYGAGVPGATGCDVVRDVGAGMQEIPSWLDYSKAKQGCLDYVSQHR